MNKATDAAREARNAYQRAWNARNKDKVKAAQQRYWERKAAAAAKASDEPVEQGA